MATQDGYCTEVQVKLHMSDKEMARLTDDDDGTTIDSDVVTEGIVTVSRLMWGVIRPRYSATTAMSPEDYTAGTYMQLEHIAAALTAEWLRAYRPVGRGQQRTIIEGYDPIMEHSGMKYLQYVRQGRADIY